MEKQVKLGKISVSDAYRIVTALNERAANQPIPEAKILYTLGIEIQNAINKVICKVQS